MIAKDKLDDAFKLVNNFKSMDLKTQTFNQFPLKHYRVPEVDGIHKGEYRKGIHKVKPSTLKYILFYLHNVDEDMIIEALIVLLYHWKVKKKDTKRMRKVYNRVYEHYTVTNKDSVPMVTINYNAVVYSISFNVGSVKFNKFGYTTDKFRFIKLIDDVKSKYPNVSVGNFQIHQVIQFKTKEQAKAFEEEAIKNLELHKDYKKCKVCFDGYKEAYLHI